MPDASRPLRLAVTNVTLGNGGDAAILYGVERALRAALPPFEMTLLETQPSVAVPAYPDYDVRVGFASLAFPQIAIGLPARARRAARWFTRAPRLRAAGRAWAAGRQDLARLLAGADGASSFEAVAEADLVVSTGGTYFVPAYWLGPRLLEFDVLHALGQPYALYTQSVGPIGDQMPRRRLGRVFSNARTVLLRGEPSRQEVLSVAPDADTHVRADAAFALADEATLAAAASRTWPSQPTVAVSLRQWPHFPERGPVEGMARYREAVAAGVTHLVREHGASVRFLSTCQGREGYRYDDSAVALDTVALLPDDVRRSVEVDREARDPNGVLRAYGEADLVIATRMHAAILALGAGTPVLPIAYEAKTDELFTEYGLREWVLDIQTMTPEQTVAHIERALAALPDVRADLFAAVDRQRADALGAGVLIADAFADRIAAAGAPAR